VLSGENTPQIERFIVPKLILTRHGQTTFNAQRRYQGQTDIPLNEVGLRQAETLRQRLAPFKLTAAYSSHLNRAVVTAQVALKGHISGLTAEPLPDLREAGGGIFEGLTFDEMSQQYPAEVKNWQADRLNYLIPEGENLTMVLARLKRALNYVVEKNPTDEDNILLVVHGGVIGVLLCHYMGVDLNHLWQWRVDSCSISILDVYKDASILSLFNDTNHIEEGLTL
jgi:broad specificity phosphatase PhoE